MRSPWKAYKGLRVRYVPNHANGDITHKDCEDGSVSSINGAANVFVKFDKQLHKFGWDGTTSQSCNPSDLIILTDTMPVLGGLSRTAQEALEE